jgi:hypothetical protein
LPHEAVPGPPLRPRPRPRGPPSPAGLPRSAGGSRSAAPPQPAAGIRTPGPSQGASGAAGLQAPCVRLQYSQTDDAARRARQRRARALLYPELGPPPGLSPTALCSSPSCCQEAARTGADPTGERAGRGLAPPPPLPPRPYPGAGSARGHQAFRLGFVPPASRAPWHGCVFFFRGHAPTAAPSLLAHASAGPLAPAGREHPPLFALSAKAQSP